MFFTGFSGCIHTPILTQHMNLKHVFAIQFLPPHGLQEVDESSILEVDTVLRAQLDRKHNAFCGEILWGQRLLSLGKQFAGRG